MEGAVLRPSDHGSRDHRKSIPRRPRKVSVLPTSSTRRLIGQKLDRLKADEPEPDLYRNMEDTQESAALVPIDDASEQTVKLPAQGKGHLTLSHKLDASVSVQWPENLNEAESELPPSSAVQRQWRASTHFRAGEHAYRSNDLAGGETWHIPVAGEFTTRHTLFRSVLSWFTGK